MTKPPEDRRRHRRLLPDATALRVRFSFPEERSTRYEAELRDVSVAGISFLLEGSHPEFVDGDTLKGVDLEILGTKLRGEVVVMHAVRRDDRSGHCGGLFFPAGDDDLLALREICRRLESAAGTELA